MEATVKRMSVIRSRSNVDSKIEPDTCTNKTKIIIDASEMGRLASHNETGSTIDDKRAAAA